MQTYPRAIEASVRIIPLPGAYQAANTNGAAAGGDKQVADEAIKASAAVTQQHRVGSRLSGAQTFSASTSLRRKATATELPTIRMMPNSDSMPTDSPHNTYPNSVAQTMLV